MNIRTFISGIILVASSSLFANSNSDAAQRLAQHWDVANYQLKGDAQQKAYEALIAEANTAKAKEPNNAEVLIWEGIIKSSYAGIKGGLGALSLAKESRAALEQAIKIDGDAMDGGAYTSLGTLYSKVPGWPVGFGDDKKAEKLLVKALEIDPNGIDANYFYADYLIEHGESAKAKQYLLTAKKAAPRAHREIGDQGRHAEIDQALGKL